MKELMRAVFEEGLANVKIFLLIIIFTVIFLLIQTKDNNCVRPYKTWLEIDFDKAVDVSIKLYGSLLKKIGQLTFYSIC